MTKLRCFRSACLVARFCSVSRGPGIPRDGIASQPIASHSRRTGLSREEAVGSTQLQWAQRVPNRLSARARIYRVLEYER